MRGTTLHLDRLPQYGTLLSALLADIVLAPLIIGFGGGLAVARGVMAIVLAAAFFAVGTTNFSTLGFLVALAALLFSTLWTSPLAVTIDLVLRAAFVGYVAVHILLRVLERERVTLDTIAGAACVYMLIGIFWGSCYQLLEHARPGSFDIPDSWRMPHGELAPAMIYFSYVTLTTIGFGDIKPTGPTAGGLVVVEAIVGQLFVAVTIARLVGLHTARRD